MNEFDLQGWERELQAWWRRLDGDGASGDAATLRAELAALADDIGGLRAHPEREAVERAGVERRLRQLLSLYDLARTARSRRTGDPS
jgi:hypothetical protein